jgi:hypothetical protein
VISHFTLRQSGEHIRRVQQALKNVQEREPELGIPAFEVSGVYDEAFAKAIYVYKSKRGIRNYANKIDDIVGIKTIRSLDTDATRRKREEPPPRPKKPSDFPRQLPNCVPEANCPASKRFEVTLLVGVSGGEIAELSRYWFTVRDTVNGLSSLYLLTAFGAGLGVPVTVSNGGGPRAFDTGDPVRVTRFGPGGGLASYTHLTSLPGIAILTLQYSADGAGLRMTTPMLIDTGDINIMGASIQVAKFSCLTTCHGGPGAVRRVITRADLIFA